MKRRDHVLRTALAAAVALVVVAASGCGGGEATPSASAATRPPVVSISSDVSDGPTDGGGGRSFCEAFSAVPTRWVEDAIVPLSIWVETWEDVGGIPARAERSVEALRTYAQLRLDWNYKRVEERPVYDEIVARHAMVLADEAVAACPDLPIVVGPTSRVGRDSMADDECARRLAELDEAIAAYVERQGRQPGHVAQLDAESYVAWAFGDGADLYFLGDDVGVEQAPDGEARAVPAPGGACDR